MDRFVVGLDAMGGDNAPGAICEGAAKAVQSMEDVYLRVFGPEEKLRGLLPQSERIEIVDAREVIDPEEAPIMEMRKKKDSSMVRCALELKEGKCQAMVSAGSTGAVLACGAFHVGRIPGIERPALAVVFPGRDKPFLLIDCGANVDCQSQHLVQFGVMGSAYMEKLVGVPKPTVGLVNIGVEADKGSRMYREAYEKMKAQKVYRFVGNVEAREIPMGACDVAVADGFDGNLILKYTEGLSSALFSVIRRNLKGGSILRQLGGLLVKPAYKNVKNSLDYEKYGGAPLLGVNGAIVKAHGSSGSEAVMNAIRQARSMIREDVTGLIRQGVEQMSRDEAK